MRISLALLLVASTSLARAPHDEVHPIVAETYYRTFSRAHPVLKRVKAGDTVVTKTLDGGGQDEKDVRRSEPGNPLTGPFFVEGAEPGDALVVHFRKIRMNRKWGWSTYRLVLAALTPESIEGLYPNRYKDDIIRPGRSNLVPWDLDLERQTVRLREPASEALKLEFPARPMLGCVGVAPAGDFAPTSGPSGSYGGNLDYNEIVEGSTRHAARLPPRRAALHRRRPRAPGRRRADRDRGRDLDGRRVRGGPPEEGEPDRPAGRKPPSTSSASGASPSSSAPSTGRSRWPRATW